MTINKNNLFGLFSAEFFQNPLPTYAHLRESLPVCPLPSSRTHKTWLITRYDDCKNLLFNEHYSTKDIYYNHSESDLSKLNTARCVLGNNLFTKDDDTHKRLRQVVNKQFLPEAVTKLKLFVESEVAFLLGSQMHKQSFDFIADYAEPLIRRILSHLLGTTSEETEQLIQLIELIFKKSASYGLLRPEVAENLPESKQYIELTRSILNKKSKSLCNDLLSHLLISSQDPQQLSEQELIAKLVILIEAAHASTVNFIPNAVYTLLTHKAQWELLKSSPSLIDSATEECLRFVSPISTTAPRWARESFTLHENKIEKGDMLLLSLTSANHDERVFTQPEQFNIERTPNRHLAFGNGPHVCLGQHLARLEFKSTIKYIMNNPNPCALAGKSEEVKWNANFAIRGLNQLHLSFKTTNKELEHNEY